MTDSTISLTLYVGGQNKRSQRVAEQLHGILRAHFGENYLLQVIDILENPEIAEEERIMVLPTVVRNEPKPCRRIFGSLSEEERVLQALDLDV